MSEHQNDVIFNEDGLKEFISLIQNYYEAGSGIKIDDKASSDIKKKIIASNYQFASTSAMATKEPSNFNDAEKVVALNDPDWAINHPACIAIIDGTSNIITYVQGGSLLDFQTGETLGTFKVYENGDTQNPQVVTIKGFENGAFSSALYITDTTDAQRYSSTSPYETDVQNPTTKVGSIVTEGGIAAKGSIMGYKVYGSVFNDYAEYRIINKKIPAGTCVVEVGDGTLVPSTERLQAGANIISDTFGFAIGETYKAQTPIAVCGRVLAYIEGSPLLYTPGAAVCAAPEGKVSLMSRAEIREYPDRIVGYVSEIPKYEYWGDDHVAVDGRIWIKIK